MLGLVSTSKQSFRHQPTTSQAPVEHQQSVMMMQPSIKHQQSTSEQEQTTGKPRCPATPAPCQIFHHSTFKTLPPSTTKSLQHFGPSNKPKCMPTWVPAADMHGKDSCPGVHQNLGMAIMQPRRPGGDLPCCSTPMVLVVSC